MDDLQRGAEKEGISLNAMFVAVIDVARAAAQGERLSLDDATDSALEFLGEKRSN